MKLSKFSEQDDTTCYQERSLGEIMTPKKWLKSISITLHKDINLSYNKNAFIKVNYLMT